MEPAKSELPSFFLLLAYLDQEQSQRKEVYREYDQL